VFLTHTYKSNLIFATSLMHYVKNDTSVSVLHFFVLSVFFPG